MYMIKILIVNLMPKKIETENQFLNIFNNVPFKVKIDFLFMESYRPKNCDINYLKENYKSFKDIKKNKYDGMIITGAPLEKFPFEQVSYWDELVNIMEYSKTNIKTTIHICWGALAGLYYHYDIPKRDLSKKIFGVFKHYIVDKRNKLLTGFDDEFLVPHSRFFYLKSEDIDKVKDLDILSKSDESGVYLVTNKDNSRIFMTGHGEYDRYTLYNEYNRDIKNGVSPCRPKNYFLDDKPVVKWKAHYNLLIINWIYHCILNKKGGVLSG